MGQREITSTALGRRKGNNVFTLGKLCITDSLPGFLYVFINLTMKVAELILIN